MIVIVAVVVAGRRRRHPYFQFEHLFVILGGQPKSFKQMLKKLSPLYLNLGAKSTIYGGFEADGGGYKAKV